MRATLVIEADLHNTIGQLQECSDRQAIAETGIHNAPTHQGKNNILSISVRSEADLVKNSAFGDYKRNSPIPIKQTLGIFE